MNRIYKIVWNKSKQCYTVASELAKSHSKSPSVGSVVRGSLAAVMTAAVISGGMMFDMSVVSAESGASDISEYVAYKVGSANTEIKQGYHIQTINIGTDDEPDYRYVAVRDGFSVSDEMVDKLDGSAKQFKITGVTKTDPNADMNGIRIDTSIKGEATDVVTLNKQALERVDLNSKIGVSNGGKGGAQVPRNFHYYITDENGQLKNVGNTGTEKIFDQYFKYVGTDTTGLVYDEKTKEYTYNGEKVAPENVYFINGNNNTDVGGPAKAGVFVVNGKVYTGIVQGNTGEILSTEKLQDGSYKTFWSTDLGNDDTLVKDSDLSIGQLEKAFDVTYSNDVKLHNDDIKEIEVKGQNNKGTIGLLTNGTEGFEDSHGANIPGTISITSEGGTTGGSGAENDVKIKFGQVGEDGQTTDKFTLDAGSKVEAVVKKGTINTAEAIKINGEQYKLDPSWTAQASGTDVAAKDGKVNFKGTDHITVAKGADGEITFAAENLADINLNNITDAGKTVIKNEAKGVEQHIKDTKYTVDKDGKVTLSYINGNGEDVEGKTAVIEGIAKNDLTNITEDGKTEITNIAKGAVKVVNGTNTTVTSGTEGDTATYAVNVTTDGTITDKNTGIVTGGTVFDALKDVSWKAQVNSADAKTVKKDGTLNFVDGNNIKVTTDKDGNIKINADGLAGTADVWTPQANGKDVKVKDKKVNFVGDKNIEVTSTGDGNITFSATNLADINLTNISEAGKTVIKNEARDVEQHIKDTKYTVDKDGKVTLSYVDGNGKDIAGKTAVIEGIAKNDLTNITESGKTEITKIAKGAVKVVNGTNTTVTPGTDGNTATYAVNVTTDGTITDKNTGIVTGGTVFDALKDVSWKAQVNGADAKTVKKDGTLNFVNGGNIEVTTDKDGNIKIGTTGLASSTDIWTAQADGKDVAAKDGKVNFKGSDHIIVDSNADGEMTFATKGLADEGLTNITDNGKTVITNIAKDAVKVVSGTNTNVTSTTDADGHTDYKVNLNNNITLGEGEHQIQINGAPEGDAPALSIGSKFIIGQDGSIISNYTGDDYILANEQGVSISKGNSQLSVSDKGVSSQYKNNKFDVGAAGSVFTNGDNNTNTVINGNTIQSGTVKGLLNKTTEYDGFADGSGRAATEEQLKAMSSNLTDTGLTFAGNTGSVNKKLGEIVTIKGEGSKDDSAYSGENVKTIVDENGNIVVKLDRNMVVDSISAGNNVFDGTGLTIGSKGSNQIIINQNNISMGGNQIHNVAAGTVDTDAVNKGQLDKAIEGAKGSDKSLVTNKNSADGNYKADVNGDVNLRVEDSTGNGYDVTIKDIASKSQLDNVKKDVSNLKNDVGDVDNIDDSLKNKDENGNITHTSVVDGLNNLNDKVNGAITEAGKHSTVSAGNGITVKPSTNENGSTDYNVSLADKFTVGDVNGKHITVDGTEGNITATGTITANKVTGLANTTWDANNTDQYKGSSNAATESQLQQAMGGAVQYDRDDKGNITNNITLNKGGDSVMIHNIAGGKVEQGSTDAVNGGQLWQTNQQVINNSQNINELSRSFGNLERDTRKGIAGAAALAAMNPLDYDPEDKWNFTAGFGHYKGETAAAIGTYYQADENTMFNLGATIGNDDPLINFGATFKLGKSPKDRHTTSTSRAAMAYKIKELQQQNDMLVQKLDELTSKVEALMGAKGTDLAADNTTVAETVIAEPGASADAQA